MKGKKKSNNVGAGKVVTPAPTQAGTFDAQPWPEAHAADVPMNAPVGSAVSLEGAAKKKKKKKQAKAPGTHTQHNETSSIDVVKHRMPVAVIAAQPSGTPMSWASGGGVQLSPSAACQPGQARGVRRPYP